MKLQSTTAANFCPPQLEFVNLGNKGDQAIV
jgi:hypothetical protein